MRELARRLRSEGEEGLALVLAVVVLAVMTLTTVAMINFTNSNQHDSALKQSGQNAYTLAEAALNQALGQLASHYYTTTKTAYNNSTSFSTSWFPTTYSSTTPNQQQAPGNATNCTTTSTCMSWGLVSWTPCASACAYDIGTAVLFGKGVVPNPTGGSTLSRTVTTSVLVQQPPSYVPTPDYWQEIYSGGPPTSGCDVTMGQGVDITAPVYIGGNLCLNNAAVIHGSTVTLRVFGWLWLRNSAKVGAQNGNPARVTAAQINEGCSNSNNTQPSTTPLSCQVNKGGGDVWDNTPSGLHTATTPASEAPPTVDFAGISQAQLDASPGISCTNGRLYTESPFNLTPSASYTCTVTDGSTTIGKVAYTYNTAGASILQLQGVVYFPNGLYIDARTSGVKYTGIGSLFTGGAITTANNALLCVAIASGDCDFANATNTGSADVWDATQNLLLLEAHGAVTGTNLHFQGGVYSDTSITMGGGQGTTQGPLVTPLYIYPGQQLNGSFPTFPSILSGSGGTPPAPYVLVPQGNGKF